MIFIDLLYENIWRPSAITTAQPQFRWIILALIQTLWHGSHLDWKTPPPQTFPPPISCGSSTVRPRLWDVPQYWKYTHSCPRCILPLITWHYARGADPPGHLGSPLHLRLSWGPVRGSGRGQTGGRGILMFLQGSKTPYDQWGSDQEHS